MYKIKSAIGIFILALMLLSCNNGERPLTPAEKKKEALLVEENKLREEKIEIEKKKLEAINDEQERERQAKIEAEKREQERVREERMQSVKKQEVLEYFKVNLSSKINEMFLEWGNSWAMDNYTHKSVEIYSITNSANPWRIKGVFGFTRLGNKKTGIFTATVSETDSGYTVSNLCYDYKEEINCY